LGLDQEKLVRGDHVSLLPWDSNFFGFPVAQIRQERLSREDMSKVLAFCRHYKVKLLQFKCDAHDRDSILLAEENNFHFADVRMILSLPVNQDMQEPQLINGIVFRQAELSDINALMKIADKLYLNSRYYFDPNFPIDRVHDFYRDWVRKAVLGQFDDLAWLICENDTPVAFCSVRFDQNNAVIGLVGVHSEFSGRGFGALLLQGVLSQMRKSGVDRVCVTTQGRNYPAQRLYQRVGFSIEKTQIYYHCWLDNRKD